MIDIEQLLPEYITAHIGDMTFVGSKVGRKYIIKEIVNDKIECGRVEIYVNDKLFDRINKQIILQPGDTLHLEYQIDVCERMEQDIR